MHTNRIRKELITVFYGATGRNYKLMMYEGLDGGEGVWYSLFIKKFSPLFISLKFWVIH